MRRFARVGSRCLPAEFSSDEFQLLFLLSHPVGVGVNSDGWTSSTVSVPAALSSPQSGRYWLPEVSDGSGTGDQKPQLLKSPVPMTTSLSS